MRPIWIYSQFILNCLRVDVRVSTSITQGAHPIILLIYLFPILLIWVVYVVLRRRKNIQNLAVQKESQQSGLQEPASLHPVINFSKCISCSACVTACPEKNVLGVIKGKGQLITPANCIGHGACKAACPVDAITLVFGTETRGVDIPNVSPGFETNVPGIYIAGELGGMGLVRNAIEQGKQAITSIKKSLAAKTGTQFDVVIIGAGPAGIAASLAAESAKMNYLTVEQDTLGGTVAHFPRQKIVMTAPVTLPLAGEMKFREVSKEDMLAYWQDIVSKHGLNIRYKERLEGLEREGEAFTIKTTRDSYQTHSVLLCLGRRGTPRKLGVPGEEQSKVVYSLTDPEQYRGQSVLVVGGGDSALEAATSLAEQAGTTVTVSYRNDSFSRAKPKNRNKIENASTTNRLRLLFSSNVQRITEHEVFIEQQGEVINVSNDAVIICAGGILPTPFLKKIGIEVETKHGTA